MNKWILVNINSVFKATAWAPDDDALSKLVEQTAFLVCTVYCSINYYVYQFVTWREKKTTLKSDNVEMGKTLVTTVPSVSAP